jgi:hypothetical protein
MSTSGADILDQLSNLCFLDEMFALLVSFLCSVHCSGDRFLQTLSSLLTSTGTPLGVTNVLWEHHKLIATSVPSNYLWWIVTEY